MANTPTRSHVPVPGSRRYQLAGSQILGRSDPGELVEVTLKLRRKQPLSEPVAGKPIAAAKLATDYGADDADLKKVESTLKAAGLTVQETSAKTRSVKVSGTAADMETAFGVQLFRAKHGDQHFRSRTGDVHVPAALEGIVVGVFGLDSRRMTKKRGKVSPHIAAAQPGDALPPANQRSWYTPKELADAYQFPSGDGAGQTIGVLEFGGHYIASDLKLFLEAVGLAATPHVHVKNVHRLPTSERNDSDAIGEVMLDVEVIAGVCPQAKINLYFSKWSEQGWIDNLDAVLADADKLKVVSVSYGLAEGDNIWTTQAIQNVNDSLKELANAGVTVCVSSGDDGSDDQVPDGRAHIDFPATSPYVLSVGGTSLNRTTQKETVWFDGDGLRRDHGGSTGGGVSEVFPRPAWQTSNIASANPHALRGRIVPDVAANAAGSTGYIMVAEGQVLVSGGTSAAAPLWASLLGLLAAAGKQIGYLTPVLYGTTPHSQGHVLGQVAFRDITAGGNAAGTAAGYKAQAGYDACTGWGSPIGSKLLELLP